MKRRLFDRLLYITCSQNWEAMSGHFWIKQCLEVCKCTTQHKKSQFISGQSYCITCYHGIPQRNLHFKTQEKNILFQLLLAVAVAGMTIQSSNGANLMPSASSVVNMADSHDRQAFVMVSKMKDEPMDVESIETNKEEVCVVILVILCLRSQILCQTKLIFVDFLKTLISYTKRKEEVITLK